MKEKLCYVEGNFAYFTTQDLDKQWGDDWNDAPYEHNAGLPYEPCIYGNGEKHPDDWNEDGSPKWEIITVAWSGDFTSPCDYFTNSPYSVQSINKGAAPWLISEYPYVNEKLIVIPAGVSIQEFKDLIKAGGGKIYLEA